MSSPTKTWTDKEQWFNNQPPQHEPEDICPHGLSRAFCGACSFYIPPYPRHK